MESIWNAQGTYDLSIRSFTSGLLQSIFEWNWRCVCTLYPPYNTEQVSMISYLHRFSSQISCNNYKQYRPERWLGEPETVHRISQTLFHFGAANHMCLGKKIVYLEICKLIPSFMRTFEVRTLMRKPLGLCRVSFFFFSIPRKKAKKKIFFLLICGCIFIDFSRRSRKRMDSLLGWIYETKTSAFGSVEGWEPANNECLCVHFWTKTNGAKELKGIVGLLRGLRNSCPSGHGH